MNLKNKKSAFLNINTKNNNNYGFNIKHQKFIFLPPLMSHLVDRYKNGEDLMGLLSNNNSYIEFENVKYSFEDVAYYIEKILFLEKNNFFCQVDFVKKISKRITPEDVLFNLANTKHIGFEVTEKCNLKCKYCIYGDYYNHYEKRFDKELPFDKGKRFIDYIFKLWNSEINQSINSIKLISFYGGEPLLNIDFIYSMVNYIKEMKNQYNIKVQYNITTNATLLRKHIDFLVSNNFNLTISLDGDSINNQYRVFKNGKPCYTVVYNNSLSILQKYPEYFKNNVKFNSVFHDKSDYLKVTDYFKNTFDKQTNIAELNPLLNSSYIHAYKSILSDLRNHDNSLNISDIHPDIKNKVSFLSLISKSRFDSYNDLLSDNKSMEYLPTGTCLPFSNKVFITANGNIFPCETIPHNIPLGGIDDSSVKIDFVEISNQYNSLYNKVINQCSACYNYINCKACIFLDIGENDKCPRFSNSKSFSNYLSNEIEYFEKDPDQYFKILNNIHNG